MTDRLRLIIGAALALTALVLLAFIGYAVGGSAERTTASGVPAASMPRAVTTSPPARPTAALSKPAAIPRTGTGRFAIAPGGGSAVGAGTMHRYLVAVETGADVDAAAFARAVEETLADPRGWTARGRWGFQRVPPGEPHAFVVKLATPATVDRICGAAGIRTSGEVSCRAGRDVVVNLRRWQLAIPAYADRPRDYQHLVVNHEVGHFLGFGHSGCPGRGRPAPAMMPQYFGLDGCLPNAWPYPTASPPPLTPRPVDHELGVPVGGVSHPSSP
ncbi:MAG: DUF3152 domain-containing protein [Hamadaea sp.]|nr:DUF3152 domain-containing protein [Hamadaea sp.]